LSEEQFAAHLLTPTGKKTYPMLANLLASDRMRLNARNICSKVGKTHKRAVVGALAEGIGTLQAAEILGVPKSYIYHARKGEYALQETPLFNDKYRCGVKRCKVGQIERTRIGAYVESKAVTPSGADNHGADNHRHILEQHLYTVYGEYRRDYPEELRKMMNEGLCLSSVDDEDKPTILDMNIRALEHARLLGGNVGVAEIGDPYEVGTSVAAIANWQLRPRDKDVFWAIARSEVSFVSGKKATYCDVCDKAPQRQLELQALEKSIHQLGNDSLTMPELKKKRKILKRKVQRDRDHLAKLASCRKRAQEREAKLKPGEVMVYQDFGALYKLDGSKAVNLVFTLVYRVEDGGELHTRYVDNWCTNPGHCHEVLRFPCCIIAWFLYMMHVRTTRHPSVRRILPSLSTLGNTIWRSRANLMILPR
jgi:hypothetical protein